MFSFKWFSLFLVAFTGPEDFAAKRGGLETRAKMRILSGKKRRGEE